MNLVLRTWLGVSVVLATGCQSTSLQDSPTASPSLSRRPDTVRVEVSPVAGEPARMTGMLSGEPDASVVDWANLDNVEVARSGKLSTLVAFAYLERKFWDVNGRYTPEIVQRNINLAIEGAGLKLMRAGDVADLTFLNAVLDEIGRKWMARADTHPIAEGRNR